MKEKPLSLFFDIPQIFKSNNFTLLPLSVKYAEKDYEAVKISEQSLKNKFPTWPQNLTFEENIESIKKHESDFENRTGFAYTILSNDFDKCLGCVYIYSIESKIYDAIVYFWVRDGILDKEFEEKLFSNLKEWLENSWTFNNIVYPGITLKWEDWYDYMKKN